MSDGYLRVEFEPLLCGVGPPPSVPSSSPVSPLSKEYSWVYIPITTSPDHTRPQEGKQGIVLFTSPPFLPKPERRPFARTP